MEISPTVGVIILLLFLGVVAWRMNSRRPTNAGGRNHANAAGPRVVCLQGSYQGQSFPINGRSLSFGRDPSLNDIVLDGPLISRRHAVLTLTSGGPVLQDYDSTNGVWVGGQRISQQQLAVDQPFQIGSYIFAFRTQSQPVYRSVAAPAAEPINAAPAVSSSVARSLDIGQYDRLQLLGDGGAAYVYLVQNRQTGEQVAVKILKHEADQYFKDKFKGEGAIGMSLRHPNIVRAMDSGESGGAAFIIMDYMPGGSLRDIMLHNQLTTQQVVTIVGQICQALQYAHSYNPPVYHRDIKPENILFDAQGTAKLADFGIARVSGQRTLTREGMIIGTPEYMSVEQAKGTEIDGRSDQYSLGVVLYEIMTGRLPFTGAPLEIVEKHLNEKPVMPSQLNAHVDKNLERVAMKTLNKDRGKRFVNMDQMAKALGYSQSVAPVMTGAPMPSPVSQTTRHRSHIIDVNSGRAIELVQPEFVIGRNLADHHTVSRNHARIRQYGEQLTIEDLNSANGTYVNGQRIQGIAQLTNGDVIQLGPVVRYQISIQ